MSGKSELLTLTPLISARFYLRPGFFDPVASKEFSQTVSLLFAILAGRFISVASKGLMGTVNVCTSERFNVGTFEHRERPTPQPTPPTVLVKDCSVWV